MAEDTEGLDIQVGTEETGPTTDAPLLPSEADAVAEEQAQAQTQIDRFDLLKRARVQARFAHEETGSVKYTNTRTATGAGRLEIEIREWIGWWESESAGFVGRVKEAQPEEIHLNIASPGGFVHDALAVHDFLRAYPARVSVDITALTASAATIIAMAADRGSLRMSDNALFLAHRARFEVWGTVDDFEEALRALQAVDGRLVNLYAKRTGKGAGEIAGFLKTESWLTAEEAMDMGFVDSVFEPAAAEAVACVPSRNRVKALGLPDVPGAYRAKIGAHNGLLERIEQLEARLRQKEADRLIDPSAPAHTPVAVEISDADIARVTSHLEHQFYTKIRRLRGQA